MWLWLYDGVESFQAHVEVNGKQKASANQTLNSLFSLKKRPSSFLFFFLNPDGVYSPLKPSPVRLVYNMEREQLESTKKEKGKPTQRLLQRKVRKEEPGRSDFFLKNKKQKSKIETRLPDN